MNAQVVDSLTIPYTIIDSDPQNADVYINDVDEGKTPYRILLKDESDLKVVIKMHGYYDYNLKVNKSLSPGTAKLVSKHGLTMKNSVTIDKIYLFNKPRKTIPIVITALLTAASGISAYYFKSKAIDQQDNYDIYGDPSVLDKKSKYDLISGVSIGVFQVSLAAFVYFLFSDN